MDIVRLSEWLQLVAAVGVIAGLMLVAYELRQNQELTRAQLNSETLAAMENLSRSRQQEPLARAIAKTHEAPLELTPAERVMLDGYYVESFQTIIREFTFIRSGLYEDELDFYIAVFARNVLLTEYGKLWWADTRSTSVLPKELVSRVDGVSSALIESLGVEIHTELMQEMEELYGF